MSDPYVLVLFDTISGACSDLADHACQGIRQVKGIAPKCRTVRAITTIETPEKQQDIADKAGNIYVTLDDLTQSSGQSTTSITSQMSSLLTYKQTESYHAKPHQTNQHP